MKKSDYLKKKVSSIDVTAGKGVSRLLYEMQDTGFQGKKLAEAAEVWQCMAEDEETTIFMGYAGSMSTTGMHRIVRWLVENRFIDVLVSTGANVSEDVFEAMGYSYFQGTHTADDVDLLKNQVNRYYDVYADELEYRRMEWLIVDFLETLDAGRSYSSAEFLWEFGKFQNGKKIPSITEAAYRAGVPVFSPAMADSSYGIAAYLLAKERKKHVVVDQMKDFVQLGEIGERSRSTSAVYIGGGVPKDTIQLVTVMKDLGLGGETIYPHKYAVQVTTDSPQWGGLSGCTFEEATSWGKIDAKASKAVVYADATIALPLISHALAERVKKKRTGQDFSWLLK
ncbi:MAG: deoxyhypusine synthase [Candidatus Micrarchaeota archaeon]